MKILKYRVEPNREGWILATLFVLAVAFAYLIGWFTYPYTGWTGFEPTVLSLVLLGMVVASVSLLISMVVYIALAVAAHVLFNIEEVDS